MTNEKTILVVDDEEFWRMRLSGYLDRRGLKVVLAKTRLEAEEILLKNERKIHFVLSDNSMETRDAGIGLCAWMRLGSEHLRTMPFVLYTTVDAGDIRKKIEELGGKFLQKGDGDGLMRAVDNLLRVEA